MAKLTKIYKKRIDIPNKIMDVIIWKSSYVNFEC